MRGTLIALAVFCWLVAARLVVAAVSTSPGYWLLAIAAAYGGVSLVRRSRRPEYRHVPPAQSTRDWDTYLAPKPAKPSTPKPVLPQALEHEVEPLDLVRDDITAAIKAAPDSVQAKLGSSGREALKMLDEHLPQDERVHHIVSAGVDPLNTVENCALVVTDLRLLFINPLPEVIAWNLTQIATVQASFGIMVTEHGGGEMHLGISTGGGQAFIARLRVAMAIATLRATA